MLKKFTARVNGDLVNLALSAQKTLNKKERLKLFTVAGIQFILSILDLVSLAAIGVLASITISGVARKRSEEHTSELQSH